MTVFAITFAPIYAETEQSLFLFPLTPAMAALSCPQQTEDNPRP